MEKLSLQELQSLILDWAREKNLLFEENAPKQRLKLIEECGELASAILKNDVQLQKDAIGDIFVVLVILAKQIQSYTKRNIFTDFDKDGISFDFWNDINVYFLNILRAGENNFKIDSEYFYLKSLAKYLNLDLTECANIAWNEIKDRKGKTVNGTFIKN